LGIPERRRVSRRPFFCDNGPVVQQTRFDVLLFDLGGVLIDFAGFEELGRLLPGSPDRKEVRARWIESSSVQRFERGAITPLQFARGVIGELGLGLSPDDFIAAFVEWARGPYPGARSLLTRLHGTFRLACLSNSNQLHTPLHRQSMHPLMDRYYFSDELGMVKPDRAIFDHVVRDLGVPSGRIAFFDDTPVNVQAARGAGVEAYEVDGFEALDDQLRRLGLLDL
jgi:HAD superfamily hydrolase (TIGR01509 family)